MLIMTGLLNDILKIQDINKVIFNVDVVSSP